MTIQLRVCNVLLQWTKKYPIDFLVPETVEDERRRSSERGGEEKMSPTTGVATDSKAFLESCLGFVEGVLSEDHGSMARQIRRGLVRRKEAISHIPNLPVLPIPKTPLPPEISVFKFPADEVAKHLTLIDFDLFARILPSELLNQAWTKSDANLRARNILALTKRFNAVACWTAKAHILVSISVIKWIPIIPQCILEKPTPRARAKRLTRMIEVASHLYTLNNFSTLMALIAGMNKAAIHRLKATFRELSSRSLKKLSDLERIMSAEGSYKNYRACLKNAVPPCLPYIGVYLIDLTYMEDGNPNNIGPRINFTKREMISSVIRGVVQLQSTPYEGIKVVDGLLGALYHLPDATEEVEKVLWEESKRLE
ncbi:hypothetical protein HDV00_005865 [Rhizophlyctis rosea]|nr:hypothetical protein HDV00_005865 [Rhizophlyctis rosea]